MEQVQVSQTEAKPQIAKFGTREEVYNGLAVMTKGKLIKDDLVISSKGRVCSKKSVIKGKQLQSIMKEKYMQSKPVETPKEEIPLEVAGESKPRRSRAKKIRVVPAEAVVQA